MSNSAAPIERRLERKSRLEDRLKWAIVLLAVVIVLAGSFMLVQFFQARNQPPRTYNDYQLRIWLTLLEKNPKDPAVLTNIAYIYLKMGQDGKALDYLQKALAIKPKFVPGLYNLGIYYKKQGQTDKAVKLLSQAAANADRSNKYLAYFTLGEIYQANKEYDKAIASYNKSLEDNATIWNTYKRLGETYEQLDKKTEALDNYQKAARFNPESLSLKKKIQELSK